MNKAEKRAWGLLVVIVVLSTIYVLVGNAASVRYITDTANIVGFRLAYYAMYIVIPFMIWGSREWPLWAKIVASIFYIGTAIAGVLLLLEW
jgi:hypothetical protein